MDYTHDELEAARAPIASLISKSEKAQQKLTPGTWQHRMLRDNIRALHIASDLMQGEKDAETEYSPTELQDAIGAITSMIGRTEDAGTKFSPGTSQYSLQRNRLKALRVAEAALQSSLERR